MKYCTSQKNAMRKLKNDNKVKVCTPFSPRYDMRWSKKNANFYDAKIALKSFQNSRAFKKV